MVMKQDCRRVHSENLLTLFTTLITYVIITANTLTAFYLLFTLFKQCDTLPVLCNGRDGALQMFCMVSCIVGLLVSDFNIQWSVSPRLAE